MKRMFHFVRKRDCGSGFCQNQTLTDPPQGPCFETAFTGKVLILENLRKKHEKIKKKNQIKNQIKSKKIKKIKSKFRFRGESRVPGPGSGAGGRGPNNQTN